jgi:phage terminase small subunit
VLTAREQQFILEYAVDSNGAAAAIRAGYSAKGAKVAAARLLKKPAIKAAIEAKQAARLQAVETTTDLNAARVLEELRRLGLSDVGLLFDEHGRLKPLQDIPLEVRVCIASIKTTKKNLTAGDGAQEDVVEVKLWDKPKALQLLAQHFALLVNRVELTDTTGLLDKVARARARLQKT